MNRIKKVVQHELNNNLFDLNNVSKKTLKNSPEMIYPLAEVIHEKIEKVVLSNPNLQTEPLGLQRDKDVEELAHIIISNSRGLKSTRSRDSFEHSRVASLLISVISYVTIGSDFSSKTFLDVSNLLLKGLKHANDDSSSSELDLLLKPKSSIPEQTYAYVNYRFFKVVCDGSFQKESHSIIDALIMIYNFSLLYITSKDLECAIKITKIEDAFQNNNFIVSIKNNDINLAKDFHQSYLKNSFVKINLFFADNKLASGLKGNCFTIELCSPEAVELTNKSLIKNNSKGNFIDKLRGRNRIHCLHNFGIYSEHKNNKEIEELFAKINDSLNKLSSPDCLDTPFAYNLLMNILRQHELKEILISVIV